MPERSASTPAILTIGHSTHPIQEFIDSLRQHGVEELVDIRTIPRSRHNPQFNSDALAKSLRRHGIGYVHLKQLGGLRHPRRDSANTGWRNASFRGYADYMQTPDFDEAVRRLIDICKDKHCALMCAEAVPWRCHRSLLADVLTARGVVVEHILGGTRRVPHSLTPFAKIENGKITYLAAGARNKKAAGDRQPRLKFADPKGAAGTGTQERSAMVRKRRKPRFTAAKEVRRRARLSAGTPPAERVIADKRRKAPKHKKTVGELAENLD
jgi:hypothetical protein